MPLGGSYPRYTNEVCNFIQDLITAGARTYNIASYLRVSDSIVSRLRGFYKIFSTVLPVYPRV